MVFAIVGTLASLVLMTLALGFIMERRAQARDGAKLRAPGTLVDIGGRRLHLICKGDGPGPLVILEAGGGNPAALDQPLQDRIARFARVCAYDRAGFGWSDPGPTGRTFEDRVADLDALLAAANLPGPYIMVGESFGGLLARDYARLNPQKVAGMVLVDAAEEAQVFAAVTPQVARNLRMQAKRNGFLAIFGVVRLAARRQFARLSHFSEETRQSVISGAARPSYWRAVADEVSAYELTPSERRVAGGFGSLGDRPLTVIRRGKPLTGLNAVFEGGWPEAQARLAALSTNSREIIARDNGHGISQENPDLVADCVREVAERVQAREGRPSR